VGSNAEEFRKRADECYRLSVQLRTPEHRSVALYLAAGWLELAQRAEKATPDLTVPIATPPAAPDVTIPTTTHPVASQPKDQIE
jgi:hypothetical protein